MAVIRQIIGSFGDIGQEIVREAAKVPGDIAGKALESMGTSSGKKQGSQKKAKTVKTPGEETLENATQSRDESVKKAMARHALEELVGIGSPKKEPTVWEKKQAEEKDKKLVSEERKKLIEKQKIPEVQTKKRRGNLYGIGIKTSSEKQKNVIAE